MKICIRLICVFIVILVVNDAAASTKNAPFSVCRFMLAAGANYGGQSRAHLRYATSDAGIMSRVFTELGGVDSYNQILLREPDRKKFWEGFDSLRVRIQSVKDQHARVELFVYYSGHSDEKGLLLGEDLLTYRELRDAVDAIPVDVRVIILDSCSSGALTRVKGGTRKPPFLMDESAQMKGHAFLTSSSEDEAAQESDRIGGSFFTHALVSGLRGAADVTQDKRVSLNEAYQFAFYETMARTEGTKSGAQHPAYDIQMVGAGDLVMTDLRGTSAGLILADNMTGRIRVRDKSNTLVVELNKPPGRSIELGLEPGDYRVIVERDGEFFGTEIGLVDGRHTEISPEELSYISSEFTTPRGGVPYPHPQSQSMVKLRRSKFSFSIWPGMSTDSPYEEQTISEISLNLLLGRSAGVEGVQAAYVANWLLHDLRGAQFAAGVNLVEGNVLGIQAAGIGNRTAGDARFGQFAGLVNSVGGAFEGIQASSVINAVEGKATAFQVAGVLNFAKGGYQGVQSSGALNISGTDMEGCQLTSGGNYAMGAFEGAQIASVFNSARSLEGLQLSLINVAAVANGSQIGLINVARSVKGAQIGLVNVAEDVVGAPIGLVSLVRHGRHNLAAWGSDTGRFNIGIKLGNRTVQSILMYGRENGEDDSRSFAGFGLSLHLDHEPYFSNIDVITMGIDEHGVDEEDVHLLHQGRIGFGWQAASRFAIIAGISVNVYTSRYSNGDEFTEGTWYDGYNNDTWVRVWPGYYLGIQI